MLKNVLFAEDSPTMRRIIKNTLSRIGFEVIVEAEDGQDALNKIDNQPVDLILTDWNMPEMNGAEFVKALRANPKYANVPIIMVTTKGMKEDVINAMKLGVNGYIVKPFDYDTLKAKLDKF